MSNYCIHCKEKIIEGQCIMYSVLRIPILKIPIKRFNFEHLDCNNKFYKIGKYKEGMISNKQVSIQLAM